MAEYQRIGLSARRGRLLTPGDLILHLRNETDQAPEGDDLSLTLSPTGAGDGLCLLRLSGPAERLEPLRPLLPAALRSGNPWQVSAGDVGGSASLSGLADDILSALLIGARPLSRWRSRFLAVLRGPAGCLPTGLGTGYVALADEGPQERLYWLPGLADVMQPPTPDRPGLLSTCWTGPTPVLTLTRGAETWHLPLTHLMLHAAPGGLFVLEWGIGGEGWPTDAGSDQPFWRQVAGLDMARRQDPVPRTLAELLDFNAALRPLYAAYEVPLAARDTHCLRLGDDILCDMAMGETPGQEGPWRALAGLMLAPWGLKSTDVALMQDERARLVGAVTPLGPPPPDLPSIAADWRVMLSRFSGVDPYAPTPAYDPDWSAAELDRSLYDRFSAFGSRYMVTDHSLTLVGHGDFAAQVGGRHLTGLYRRLFLVALLRAAAAQGIRADLASLPDVEAVTGIAHLWRPFLLTLGHGPMTGQMQGVELFARMLDATAADTLLADALSLLDRAAAG
ncbi:hypothetical protein [Niveispirillum sp.]|uniref:hypothetical protein n=1 Tax=Niveispirillum sp. TaxID=1917217 RepID=UPI001B7A1584|nr:hypothetical protein [Niveispirillum sp.]MBP7339272.1 hypothetical protein [Niveispirillum sp.]